MALGQLKTPVCPWTVPGGRALLRVLLLLGMVHLMEDRSRAVQLPQQTFRAGTELVAVRVSLRRDGRPVRGLSAKDFVVLDNGEPRSVDAVDAGTVPVDLAVIVVGDGASHLWQNGFERPLAEVRSLLGPGDRLGVTSLADGVTELVPLGEEPRLHPVLRPGQSALLDAVARELLLPVPAGRQRAVLAIGFPSDVYSVLSHEALLRLARAAPARLDIALAGLRIVGGGVPGTKILQRTSVGASMGWDFDSQRTGRLWAQSRELDRLFELAEVESRERFSDLAEATGGRLLDWRGGSLRRAVEEALAEIREGYLLYFRPSASAAPGWHRLQVQVLDQTDLRITSRSGYVR